MITRIVLALIAVSSLSFSQMRDPRFSRLPAAVRITRLEAEIRQNPKDLQAPALLAEAYMQRMRETTDYSYAARAQKLIDGVLKADPNFYEAIRVQIEIHLFRHEFDRVIERSRQLAALRPADAVN